MSVLLESCLKMFFSLLASDNDSLYNCELCETNSAFNCRKHLTEVLSFLPLTMKSNPWLQSWECFIGQGDKLLKLSLNVSEDLIYLFCWVSLTHQLVVCMCTRVCARACTQRKSCKGKVIQGSNLLNIDSKLGSCEVITDRQWQLNKMDELFFF